eukprot:TRINITY_DN4623_c0_g1_i13.p1 TRINITY_DN4623_c0_g1~~TRINITY_DN4623_c0_g1_i13.p1  ORF type:complete len:305 (+),score=67.78 TRINITY_DN4623_c0_g1_i13:992-1906(+)
MLSGIGPRDTLSELKIPVVSNLLGVGQNWSDHLYALLTHVYSSELFSSLKTGDLSELTSREVARYEREKTGMLSRILGDVMGYFSCEGGRLRKDGGSDFQVIFFPFLDQVGSDGFEPLEMKLGSASVPTPAEGKLGVSFSVGLSQPRSRGEIRLVSSDPFQAPELDPMFYKDREDLLAHVRAVRWLEGMLKEGFGKLGGVRFENEVTRLSDEELEELVLSGVFHGWHGCGTCKMGSRTDESTVVDPHLKVVGVEGLRVVDCSVMPVCTAGNINAPTIMIGEKGSDIIKQAHPDLYPRVEESKGK